MAFVWTFPSYILVAITERGSIAFSAPDEHIAIFTDFDTAERCRGKLDMPFTVLPVYSAGSLQSLLRDIEPQYQGVIVDHNMDTGLGRAFSFPAVYASLPSSDS